MFYLKEKDMYIFTKEEKAEANNTSVIDYLNKNYGYTFKRSGNGYRCCEHESLFIHDDEKSWYWNSHGYGGCDVIEFVKKHEHKSYEEALKSILNPIIAEKTIGYSKAPAKNDLPKERELLLPAKKDGKYNRVYAYLTKTRCIDPVIVSTLLRKKFIYEDTRNNCVFVGYNKLGLPAYASLRTTYTERQFRHDAIGSDKSNGFYIRGYNRNKIYVFEAPIDLLSHATLSNIKSNNVCEWLNTTRLSLGGVSDKALARFCIDYPEVNEIIFCLDNDAAGKEATEKYMLKYADKGYAVHYEPPTLKDYNDDLQNLIKKLKPLLQLRGNGFQINLKGEGFYELPTY